MALTADKMRCKYERFPGKLWCPEEAWGTSAYCVLHTDLPEDATSEAFQELNELKIVKVNRRLENNNYDFSGVILRDVDFSGRKIVQSLCFEGAVIKGDAIFNDVDICGKALFDNAKIGGNTRFIKAKVKRGLSFHEAKLGGNFQFESTPAETGGSVNFEGAEVKGDVSLSSTKILGELWFRSAVIDGGLFCDSVRVVYDAFLYDATIKGFVVFNAARVWGELNLSQAKIGASAWFERAVIGGDVSLYMTQIGGEVDFKTTRFRRPEAQEIACRTAKQICERLGDRTAADDYFYREMEAKRRHSFKLLSRSARGLTQSLQADYLYVRYIENSCKRRKKRVRFLLEDFYTFISRSVRYFITLVVEGCFGYGVRFLRLMATYFIIVIFFGLFYFYNQQTVLGFNDLENNVLFSFFTIIAPGYGISNIKPWIPQASVAVEAAFGAFLWAALIAIFVKKYMR